MANMTHARDGSGCGIAVHHAGIQFMSSVSGIDRADTRIEERTRFQQAHRFRHYIKRCQQGFQSIFLPADNFSTALGYKAKIPAHGSFARELPRLRRRESQSLLYSF